MAKILYWTPEFYPEIGGIENISRQALPALQKLGHEFKVITSHGRRKNPDITKFSGITVHRFFFREALNKNNLNQIVMYKKKITEIIERFKPDLIHYHWGDPYAYFLLITMNDNPIKTLITLHRSVADYCKNPDTITYKLLDRSKWVVAVSKANLTDAVKAVPKISTRSSVIYNGLKESEVKLNSPDFDNSRLLCVGRVVKEKGFDIAIKAFKKIHKHLPQTRLIIAGDGLELNNLKRLANKLNLYEHIDFTGWIDPSELPDLINSSTIVVIPSRCSDSFPLVALEAAQFSKPVIASNKGGLSESVVNNKTGLLVDNENPEQLAKAIIGLLKNPEKMIRFGKNGKERIDKNFTLRKYVDEYNNLYKKIIS